MQNSRFNFLFPDPPMVFTAKLVFTCGMVLVLVACSTPNVPSSYSPDPSGKNGVAILSITYSGSYSGYGVYYREIDSKSAGLFEAGQGKMIIPLPDKSDFGSLAKGKLIVAELPAGEYDIFSWRISSGYATVTPTSSFSIRFRIDPGKAVYVGNFHFNQTARMGLTVTAGNLTFKGEQYRDLSTLRSKYPNFANLPISLATPSDVSFQKLGGADNVRFVIPIFVGW